jgi:hypothetical protein
MAATAPLSRVRGSSEPCGKTHDDWLKPTAYAALQGIDLPTFRALPDAAKYAWAWRALNEAALEELESLPSARLVIYENLCVQPETAVREHSVSQA